MSNQTVNKPIKGFVYVLLTCSQDGTSQNGFKWPKTGPVECNDWEPTAECGNGLHGLLWGAGDFSLLNWSAKSKWLVVKVAEADVVKLDGGLKVKFPKCTVEFYGDRDGAIAFIRDKGADPLHLCCQQALDGDYGQALAGVFGQALVGVYGQASAGDYGQAFAGMCGQASVGDYGQALAGHLGQASAGKNGIIICIWCDPSGRHRVAVGYTGEQGIKAGYWYRANGDGELIEVGPVEKSQ